MAAYNFKAQRLYVKTPLAQGALYHCDDAQNHYLRNVLRLKVGAQLYLFNGQDGEWRGQITQITKADCIIQIEEQARTQTQAADILYLFAPLKRARLDYMVQKAVEMGVSQLQPVMTQYTNNERIKQERMEANAIEAAEQCGILSVPAISPIEKLPKLLDNWNPKRQLIFCDESAKNEPPFETLKSCPLSSVGVLIGPEGGFSPEERADLLGREFVIPLSLGNNILRADTAAVAALALINATLISQLAQK